VPVTLGSRSAERAAEIVAPLLERWAGRDLPIGPGSNEQAAEADIVVVATPWDAAAPTAGALAERLEGKVVVSMANALARVGEEFEALVPARGSIAVAVQAALPRSRVAGAFHHLPARSLGRIDRILKADVLVAADDASARAATIELVETMPGLRGVAAGSLANCAAIEALTAVLLNVNVSHRAHTAVRLTGLPERAS
jgi:NADPH-dependent F420 reductase